MLYSQNSFIKQRQEPNKSQQFPLDNKLACGSAFEKQVRIAIQMELVGNLKHVTICRHNKTQWKYFVNVTKATHQSEKENPPIITWIIFTDYLVHALSFFACFFSLPLPLSIACSPTLASMTIPFGVEPKTILQILINFYVKHCRIKATNFSSVATSYGAYEKPDQLPSENYFTQRFAFILQRMSFDFRRAKTCYSQLLSPWQQ